MKTLVVRTGAIGDMIMITPVLRQYKKEGDHVTLFTTEKAWDIVKKDPNIDDVVFYQKPEDDKTPKWEHVDRIKKNYDLTVNLSGQLEEKLLVTQRSDAWYWPHEKRHTACNLNYVENMLEILELDKTDTKMELFFSPEEHREAKRSLKKFSGKFVIMWALAGSAFHKLYPYSEHVCRALVNKYPDIWIFTAGDFLSKFLEWQAPNTKNYCNMWSLRKSMLMTKYVQCVVGPETGLLNAAACFDTPKVIMLSHSSVENLTRDWTNTTNVEAYDASCHPCHKLVHELEMCPLEPGLRTPICSARIKPKQMFDAIEAHYLKWKEKRA